jgi:hypothetical protein
MECGDHCCEKEVKLLAEKEQIVWALPQQGTALLMYHQGISLKCAKVTEPGIIAHPRIPATQVVEVGESRLKASLVQKCKTLSGKKKNKNKPKSKRARNRAKAVQ